MTVKQAEYSITWAVLVGMALGIVFIVHTGPTDALLGAARVEWAAITPRMGHAPARGFKRSRTMSMTICEPGKPPVEIELGYEPDLELMQKLVGGYIECVSPGPGMIQYICDEEGLLKPNVKNDFITNRLTGIINLGPCAVGTWLMLTGKERLT